MMKPIDIQGSYATLLVTADWNKRTSVAAFATAWACENANAAWCVAPDHTGEIEVTFALEDDLRAFGVALFAGEETA